jgi:anionic cell wall polymer biosynthesis LytR-Cps2A-Psr (LCP) family protein
LKKALLVLFASLLVGCVFTPVDVVVTQTMDAIRAQVKPSETPEQIDVKSSPTSLPSPTVTSTPRPHPGGDEVRRYLILGGDWRQHRAGSRYGNKTDVMILVQIRWDPDHEDRPATITMIQFPRNFYTPVENMADQWLFAVYRREEVFGTHYYFQQVFDVDLDGIFYISMDNFVTLVNSLMPLDFTILATVNDEGFYGCRRENCGEDLLAWIRNNDNNWGCPTYDCGDRQMRALLRIVDVIRIEAMDRPIDFLFDVWKVHKNLFETDLSTNSQIKDAIEIGYNLVHRDFLLQTYKLTESDTIIYGNTPLEVRGWIPVNPEDVKGWMTFVLGG